VPQPIQKPLIPLSPKPRDGAWDWTKRYWNLHERVTVHAGKRPTLAQDTAGTITGIRKNQWGRIVYNVACDDGQKLTHVLTEELLPECWWPGSGTVVYSGQAARRAQKEAVGS
jgi:hypothetical protein